MLASRRVLAIGGAIGVLAAIAVGAYFVLRNVLTASSPQQETYRSAIVERGNLRETISATAPLEAQRRVDLTFLQSGQVEAVLVEPGQRVRTGDLLMTLDSSRAQLDLADAQLAVELQRIALEQLRSGPSPNEIASAAAAVQRAQAQLNQISQPVSEETIRIAQANLQLAESQRAIAYQDWSNQIDLYGSGYQVDIAQKRAESAELAVEIAKLELANAQEGASSGQVNAARAAVHQAQAALSRLLEGPNEVDLRLAELQIAQAELALESARASLDDMRITAPFSGIVSAVNYKVGEQAIAGLPAVTLLDDSSFHIDILVDEVDIARVKEGQLAFITLDAYPDAQVSGHVEHISPIAINVGGVTSFEVRVRVEASSVPLRDGMTASVEIVVSELTGVLLVPNWAIRFDRTTGKAYVNVLRSDGTVEEVEIELGARGATMSEVRRGLEEGDTVVVSLQREGLNLFSREGQ